MTEQKGSLVRQLYMPAVLCTALWGSAAPCIKAGYGLFGIQAGQSFSQLVFAGCKVQKAQDHPTQGGMAADPVDQPVPEHDPIHMLLYRPVDDDRTERFGVIRYADFFCAHFRASVPAER